MKHRNRILGPSLVAASLAALAGCGGYSGTTPTSTSTGGTGGSSACVATATETAGPYPDTIGMLGNAGFFRQDVREGKPGLPLTLQLTIVNTNNACAAVADAQVEIWQADADGHYSEYQQPGFNGVGQTFLRGLQTTNASGLAVFLTIYPGWELGRAAHIHVEVFVHNQSVKITQLAFPEDITRSVYSTGAYVTHGQNPTTNAADPVFADGTSTQMLTLVGSPTSSYTATLKIGIAL